MTPNPKIIKSVEKLDYRVTVGDVAAQAGLELNFAQQGLLTLAGEAGGHLQVAESGDVVYLFPKKLSLYSAEQVLATALAKNLGKSLASLILSNSYFLWHYFSHLDLTDGGSNYCHSNCHEFF